MNKEPTFWTVVFDFPGSIYLWIAAIWLTIQFPPAILLLIGFGFWRRGRLRAKAEVESRRYVEEAARAEATRRREMNDLTRRAQAGDADAQYRLGLATWRGEGATGDARLSAHWFEKAAAQQHHLAALELGRMLMDGTHTGTDLDAAERWLRVAASGRAPDAEDLLQLIVASRQGSEEDEQRRRRLRISPERWFDYREDFALCESEPEAMLLEALVDQANLQSLGGGTGSLHGNVNARALPDLGGMFVTVDVQQPRGRYRPDFLVNEWLVVEVDGKAYHESGNAFERDRRRDRELVMHGLTTVRYPASEIYQDASSVARDVIRLAIEADPRLRMEKYSQTLTGPKGPS